MVINCADPPTFVQPYSHFIVSCNVDAVTVVLFRLFSVFANRQFVSDNLDRIDEMLETSCHEREVYMYTKDDVTIAVVDVSLSVCLFICLSVYHPFSAL